MSDVRVEIRRREREKELSVVRVEMAVQVERRDDRTERGGIKNEQYRTEDRALRYTAQGGV